MNDAGVDSSGKQVADIPAEVWDDELKANLYGPFYCCQQFIRERRRAGGRGKIINITSVHEGIPRAGSAGYDAAKGGLRNLTRTLALELAPDHINVNNIAPGMVLTPFNQSAIDDPKIREEQVQSIPWKRAGEPCEIAKLAVYLASERRLRSRPDFYTRWWSRNESRARRLARRLMGADRVTRSTSSVANVAIFAARKPYPMKQAGSEN